VAWKELGALGVAMALMAAPVPSKADGTAPTKLAVGASAQTELTEDELVASLEAHAEGEDPGKLQARINGLMSKALAAANAVKAVKVSTGSYRVDSRYDEAKKLRYVGSQRLELSSAEPGPLLELVGHLQEMGLATSGLDYTVADATRRAAERGLIAPALAELRDKADLVAKAMGMRVIGWEELNVDSSPMPGPVFRAAPMAMAAKAPVAQAGQQEVSVSVQGTALLATTP
jgi:predicted secreted protein